jgi:hypothetical protein
MFRAFPMPTWSGSDWRSSFTSCCIRNTGSTSWSWRTTLSQLRPEALPELSRLEKALAETDVKRRLALILVYLEKLKAVIVSETVYEIREDIYQKRHITIDILHVRQLPRDEIRLPGAHPAISDGERAFEI